MMVNKKMRRRVGLYGLLAVLLADCMFLPMLVERLSVPRDDFIAYWATGRLFATGQNPYDPRQLFQMEKVTGWKGEGPLMVWYPPWVLPLIVPLSWLPYAVGRLAWLLFSLIILFTSGLWLWRIYDGPPRLSWLALMATGAFAPALFSLAEGQIISLVLVGIAGFLHFQKQRKWIPAGICAGLIAIKPQLLGLFWLALLLWSLRQKRLSLMLAAFAVLAASTLVALIANPALLGQYVLTILQYPPDGRITATFGAALRWAFGHEHTWVHYVALIPGVIWVIIYWRRHRTDWDWTRQLPPILYACVITAPFAWMHDATILLVAVVQALVLLSMKRKDRKTWIMGGFYLLLNIVALAFIDHWRYQQMLYIWLPWAFLLWYLGTLLNRGIKQ